MDVENCLNLVLPCLEVGAIFFKYRDVIKTATRFVVMMTIIRVALTFVESVDKMEFLWNFSEQ